MSRGSWAWMPMPSKGTPFCFAAASNLKKRESAVREYVVVVDDQICPWIGLACPAVWLVDLRPGQMRRFL